VRLISGAEEGGRLRQFVRIELGPGRLRQENAPPEFTCPSCGRDGPLVQGELLAADTTVHCRRRWICRYSWPVPAAMPRMVCPRCVTAQPGPGASPCA
jgi:hypothetical protein